MTDLAARLRPLSDEGRARVAAMIDAQIDLELLTARFANQNLCLIFGSARFDRTSPSGRQGYELAELWTLEGNAINNGGGPGTMAAAQQGARDGSIRRDSSLLESRELLIGSHNVGALIAGERPPPDKAAEPNYVEVADLSQRQAGMIRPSIMAALHVGGGGTGFEFFDVLTKKQLVLWGPSPIVLVDPPGEDFWTPTINVLRQMAKYGTIDVEDLAIVERTNSPEGAMEIWRRFSRNYRGLYETDTHMYFGAEEMDEGRLALAETVLQKSMARPDLRLELESIDGRNYVKVAREFASRGHQCHRIVDVINADRVELTYRAETETSLRETLLEQLEQLPDREPGVARIPGGPSELLAEGYMIAQRSFRLGSLMKQAQSIFDAETAVARLIIENADMLTAHLLSGTNADSIAHELEPIVNSHGPAAEFLRKDSRTSSLMTLATQRLAPTNVEGTRKWAGGYVRVAGADKSVEIDAHTAGPADPDNPLIRIGQRMATLRACQRRFCTAVMNKAALARELASLDDAPRERMHEILFEVAAHMPHDMATVVDHHLSTAAEHAGQTAEQA